MILYYNHPKLLPIRSKLYKTADFTGYSPLTLLASQGLPLLFLQTDTGSHLLTFVDCGLLTRKGRRFGISLFNANVSHIDPLDICSFEVTIHSSNDSSTLLPMQEHT
jgi:hypothetical protein